MTPSPLRLEWTFLGRHKALFAAALVCRAAYELVPMQVPFLAGMAVDALTGKAVRVFGVAVPNAEPGDVVRVAGLGLLAVAVAHGVAAYAATVTGARLDRRFVAELRKAVVEKLMALSLDHHQRYGAAALQDRAVRDADRLRGFTERVFTRTITNAVRAAYPVAMLFAIHPVLALVALAVLPPQWLAVRFLQARLHAATRRSQARHTDLSADVGEHLDAVETLQGVNAGAAAVARLHDRADTVEADELAVSRVTALIRATTWAMAGVAVGLIWWKGGALVQAGELTVGRLVAFVGFAELTYRPFRRFTDLVKTYRAGMVSLERIRELLALPPSVTERPDARPLRVPVGAVSLRGVSLAYGDRPALTDVTVEIAGGRLTAVVGSSGSGKSSLLRLVARLYDPDTGRVLIDGEPLEEGTLGSLRSRVAILPQRAAVFSGTVLENVRLARPDATEGEVRAACAAAAALAFIDGLPDGFDTRLGRGGTALSGGEAQRLALARALLSRPKVLLLDEPTAALDAGSEAAVLDALLALRGETTVILVGHRLEGVRRADRVIVLDAGRVVAEGTHEELLALSPAHRALFGTGEAADAGAA